MKSAFAALALLSCGICSAAEDVGKQVRVSLQWIEVPHPVLTEMLSGKETGGQVLHEKAVALCKEGKAKILETCMVVCPSGGKATAESIREEIYPTEYEPPYLCGDLGVGLPGSGFPSNSPPDDIFKTPTAFDTRNTGATFEVESTVSSNHTIQLRLIPEIVTRRQLDTLQERKDHWGDRSYRMPNYESWRFHTDVRVKAGKFELVSVITPAPNAPVPAVLRKLMVFVRADAIGTEP